MAEKHPYLARKYIRDRWCPECQRKMVARSLITEAGTVEMSYHCEDCDYEAQCSVFDEVDEVEFSTRD